MHSDLSHKRHQLYLPGMQPLDAETHYNSDTLAEKLGLVGAGPLAFITKDQLHPPMVDDESIWRDGSRWYEGAVKHTIEAAELCQIQKKQRVLDVGCGICGPARTLVDNYSVDVVGATISTIHADTAWKINSTRHAWRKHIEVHVCDCQAPMPWKDFDCAWSMNMLYHIKNKEAMLENIKSSLRPGGKLMLDDWMLTRRATEIDSRVLGERFVGSYFAQRDDIVPHIARAGFFIHHVVDLGHIGRRLMAKHFQQQYDSCFRNNIANHYGVDAAHQFCEHIQFTINMYLDEKLTWCRIVAVNP